MRVGLKGDSVETWRVDLEQQPFLQPCAGSPCWHEAAAGPVVAAPVPGPHQVCVQLWQRPRLLQDTTLPVLEVTLTGMGSAPTCGLSTLLVALLHFISILPWLLPALQT